MDDVRRVRTELKTKVREEKDLLLMAKAEHEGRMLDLTTRLENAKLREARAKNEAREIQRKTREAVKAMRAKETT